MADMAVGSGAGHRAEYWSPRGAACFRYGWLVRVGGQREFHALAYSWSQRAADGLVDGAGHWRVLPGGRLDPAGCDCLRFGRDDYSGQLLRGHDTRSDGHDVTVRVDVDKCTCGDLHGDRGGD